MAHNNRRLHTKAIKTNENVCVCVVLFILASPSRKFCIKTTYTGPIETAQMHFLIHVYTGLHVINSCSSSGSSSSTTHSYFHHLLKNHRKWFRVISPSHMFVPKQFFFRAKPSFSQWAASLVPQLDASLQSDVIILNVKCIGQFQRANTVSDQKEWTHCNTVAQHHCEQTARNSNRAAQTTTTISYILTTNWNTTHSFHGAGTQMEEERTSADPLYHQKALASNCQQTEWVIFNVLKMFHCISFVFHNFAYILRNGTVMADRIRHRNILFRAMNLRIWTEDNEKQTKRKHLKRIFLFRLYNFCHLFSGHVWSVISICTLHLVFRAHATKRMCRKQSKSFAEEIRLCCIPFHHLLLQCGFSFEL